MGKVERVLRVCKFSVKRVRAIYRRKYRDNCNLFGCMYMERNVDLYILIKEAVNVMRLVSPACSNVKYSYTI